MSHKQAKKIRVESQTETLFSPDELRDIQNVFANINFDVKSGNAEQIRKGIAEVAVLLARRDSIIQKCAAALPTESKPTPKNTEVISTDP